MTTAERTPRQRLDAVVVEQQLAPTRSQARALILAGDVLVNGRVESHAGTPVGTADVIALGAKPRFVGRGGEKLDFALDRFALTVEGRVAADFGTSTGGFTDCLLQRGAEKVYAVDVGYGQLDDRLRRDGRVVVMERTNARYLEALPEPVSLVVVDVSFISLRLMFPTVVRVLAAGGDCVPLIKPQFEAGRSEVGKGGVVRQAAVHRRVLVEIVQAGASHGLYLDALVRSPLKGPAGNVEFLAHFRRIEASPAPQALAAIIDHVMDQDAPIHE